VLTVKEEILKTTIYQPHRFYQKSNDAETFRNSNFHRPNWYGPVNIIKSFKSKMKMCDKMQNCCILL